MTHPIDPQDMLPPDADELDASDEPEDIEDPDESDDTDEPEDDGA